MKRAACLAAVAALCLSSQVARVFRPASAATRGVAVARDATPEVEAREICGTKCHAFPPASILPRSAWRNAVARMTLFRNDVFEIPGPPGTEGEMVTLPPDMARVLAYYEAQAPASLGPPPTWPAPGMGKLRFRRRLLSAPLSRTTPAASNVRLLDLDGDARLELIVCDMRHGVVMRGRPYDPEAQLDIIMDVPHPAHAEVIDLDRDGTRDLLIADLGGFLPADHTRGAVVWLRGLPKGEFASYTLGGLPRVADVQAADFDGDGDLDLAVAAFGWRRTGETMLMENRTTEPGKPVFERWPLDARAGAIHVPPVDLNRDGQPDIVSLVSQQHETIVALMNEKGTFTMETIYKAPHPNWGSSGIQVIDLDRDGDLDVLFTHGDSFDDYIWKPYHGIQWLENQGGFPFKMHELASMPGVHRAQAADLDGDGDLDIVATALIVAEPGRSLDVLASLVWLEQVKPGRFEKRTLEMGKPTHATLDLGDYDLDGDVDMVVGQFATTGALEAWVEIWENVTSSGDRAIR